MIPLPFNDRVRLVYFAINYLVKRYICIYGKKAVIKALSEYINELDHCSENVKININDRTTKKDLQNM